MLGMPERMEGEGHTNYEHRVENWLLEQPRGPELITHHGSIKDREEELEDRLAKINEDDEARKAVTEKQVVNRMISVTISDLTEGLRWVLEGIKVSVSNLEDWCAQVARYASDVKQALHGIVNDESVLPPYSQSRVVITDEDIIQALSWVRRALMYKCLILPNLATGGDTPTESWPTHFANFERRYPGILPSQ
jgi:hypothetical protein